VEPQIASGNAFGVFFLFCFIGVYALCINATSYIYCGEIFPTHMRSQGVAFSLTAQFITTIIFVQTAPMGFANIGWRFYLIFIVCCCVSAFILYFYFPETKQKSLEEIGEAFGDEIAQNSAVGRATDVKSGELEDLRQLEDVSDHSKSV
jgi:MFS family permease